MLRPFTLSLLSRDTTLYRSAPAVICRTGLVEACLRLPVFALSGGSVCYCKGIPEQSSSVLNKRLSTASQSFHPGERHSTRTAATFTRYWDFDGLGRDLGTGGT